MNKRTVDAENLNDIFDIENDNSFFGKEGDVDSLLNSELKDDEVLIDSISVEPVTEQVVPSEEVDPDIEYINNNLKEMVKDVKDIISAAKYLIDSSPDEHTIAAASTLFQSAVSLLKELNKGVLQSRKERHTMKLEQLKIKSRENLAVLKHKLNPLKQLGSGNTINIDNRQVSFTQEAVVREYNKLKENKSEQLTDRHDESN
jgi:hypothetical protein